MVAGEREGDGVDEINLTAAPHRPYVNCADAEDRDLRRIEQRRERFDAERAEVGDGEGRAGEVVGRDGAGDGLIGQLSGASGQLVDGEVVSIADNGHEEAARSVAGEADVNIRVFADLPVDVFGVERGDVEERFDD